MTRRCLLGAVLLLIGCAGSSSELPLPDGPAKRDGPRPKVDQPKNPPAPDLPLPAKDWPPPAPDQPKPKADLAKPDQPKPKPDLQPPDAPSLCGSGETQFGGHCYRVTGIKWISYTTAKTMCGAQSPPMTVVTITSAAENQFVYSQLPPLNQVAWIGMQRTGSGTTSFAWDNGEPVTYWNWATGEPNNENGKENCVIMWGPNISKAGLASKWNDMPCDYANVDAVICERAP